MRAAERLAGVVCLSTINGRAGKAGKALGWMLAEAELGRRQQIFEHPAYTPGRGRTYRLLWLRARATMSCRCSVACTNRLVNYCCCEDLRGRECFCCIHPQALPSSSPRTLPQVKRVELVAGPTTTLPPDSRPISQQGQFTTLDSLTPPTSRLACWGAKERWWSYIICRRGLAELVVVSK
jgi:hypothetical protein